ncbi:hypothetical protein F4859DRAFT_453943 [Xylaria cf. heliscus]|nr:hypothetical protein F4859DRAFT_453943 [Xylaria cf. heliscus]
MNCNSIVFDQFDAKLSTATMDQQPSNEVTVIASAHQELEETPSEDTKMSHDLQLQILRVLEQLRDCQRDYMSLRQERWGVAHDIPRMAQELWVSGIDAWIGLEDAAFWTDTHPGKKFLNGLVPNVANLQAAKPVFEKWVTDIEAYSAYWDEDSKFQIINNEYQWPDKWQGGHPWTPWDFFSRQDQGTVCCMNTVTCASPDLFGDPFCLERVYSDEISNRNKDLPETLRSNTNICGIIVQFSISRYSDVIDLSNAAAIICLVQGSEYTSGPTFLEGHIARWREQSEDDRYGMANLNLSDDLTSYFHVRCDMMSGVFMYYMRSFIVLNRNEKGPHTKRQAPGLKCLREHVSFQGFYDGTMTRLIEKRYSTALGLLPLQAPSGHYCLVSICDGQQKDVKTMFEESPAGSVYSGQTHKPWEKYGIYPAGLYTGISMFQIQICVFIDAWEQDWTVTIKQIDEMVSLKLDVLDDDKHLRNVVLGNSADASVLYFKVLQILNNFSDIVRAAPSYLDRLSNNVRNSGRIDYWFEESYPHTENTQNILKHNWKMVKERQRDASNRILSKLERTTNEVKSLQSGLFNVQSITEARKSRVLNKYLMVFTIVTILFLPPTFVATFFGMHIFDANSIDTTQKTFWLVLGALSGGTYLIAALGLFGSNLSAEERKKWETDVRESVSEKLNDLAAWFKNTQWGIRNKIAQVSRGLNSESF